QNAAGRAWQCRGAGVAPRPATGIDRRTVARRHVGGVENVLDAERDTPEHCVLPRPVGLARLDQRRLAGEVAPRAHHRLAFGNALETAADDSLGRQLAALE